ncbi:hypothetical protein Nepgr_022742 [Nepenthes gracilis]|uniref:Uncharacterized protein n=1 Tax=Nepenthes gracilis TaxID=150966 RepID=A0AAD3T014_NEPGR|nr:hypothetical protein Nepgr_022742 [Nepenthes gracilis]
MLAEVDGVENLHHCSFPFTEASLQAVIQFATASTLATTATAISRAFLESNQCFVSVADLKSEFTGLRSESTGLKSEFADRRSLSTNLKSKSHSRPASDLCFTQIP